MLKRITITVPVSVSLSVFADDSGGDVQIVQVERINGLPSPKEVMEAIDAAGEFEQLDEAFERAADAAETRDAKGGDDADR